MSSHTTAFIVAAYPSYSAWSVRLTSERYPFACYSCQQVLTTSHCCFKVAKAFRLPVLKGAIQQQKNGMWLKKGVSVLQKPQTRHSPVFPIKAAVIEIDSQEQLDQELEKAKDKLAVLDFSTTWCGPCKVVAPKYEEMSEKYHQVVFLKVIGDKNGETNKIMKSFGIRAVPTFKLMKSKQSIFEVSGARIDALEDAIKSYM
eukprot:jgi/Galph1/4310/GphlegSOOS_G3021.1